MQIDSLEISRLIFFEKLKKNNNIQMLSAAIVIGALR